MPSAGQLLQSERLNKNRTIADIADATRISARYIEALERDDVAQLPGAFFYKAFIRQYARALNLDEPETERVLRAAVSLEEVDPVPAFNQAYTNATTGQASGWAPPVGLAVGLLVAVIACGAGLYAIYQRFQARQSETPQTAAAASNPVTTPPAPQNAVPAPLQAPQPASAQSGSSTARPESASSSSAAKEQPGLSPTLPAGQTAAPMNGAEQTQTGGETSLELVALEPAWVQLSSGGKTVFIGTLDPSQPKQFRVAENARLVTGNAGALEIRVNGKPIGSIGPRGQVRTLVFSDGNFQIAPPRPRITPGTTSPVGSNT